MATKDNHEIVPDLGTIMTDPAKVTLLPLDAIPTLRGELARLDTLLLARLLLPGNGASEPESGDRLLSAEQAAAKLGTCKDYLYRHSANLPFTVRMGRKVRFSEVGIERYIRQRTGR